jgi:hypothetical protein
LVNFAPSINFYEKRVKFIPKYAQKIFERSEEIFKRLYEGLLPPGVAPAVSATAETKRWGKSEAK